MFGLMENELDFIIESIKSFTEIEKACIFGSRATGKYKKASDVDICIYGNITINTVASLKYILDEESTIPLYFDVVAYNIITDKNFKNEIDSKGKEFYRAK